MHHLNIHIDSYERDGDVIIGNIHTIINASDRIAIVGPNGVGKSTFLRILSGEIREYTGTVENIGNISLGYLEQIHFMDESKSVRDELRDAYAEIRALEQIIEREEQHLAETGEYEAYTEAIEAYKLMGGYTYENEIERVARGIGIYHLLSRPLSGVSGGERTKIALAKTLLSKPEFLLLDEPTNFIDLSSVEWLEKYLQETWRGGYAIVSHDREFLDETVTKVIEITGPKGIIIYAGNYSDSVAEKRHKRAIHEKDYEEQQALIDTEKSLINRFRAGSRAGFAKSREKMLDRMDIIEKPETILEIGFRFDTPKERPPELLLKIEEAFIGRMDPLFFIREATLSPGERIGIVGENGVGKSTFIKTILANLPESIIRTESAESVRHDSEISNRLDQSMERSAPRNDKAPKSDIPGKEVPLGGESRGLEPKKLKVLEGYLHLAKTISVGYYSQMHETLHGDMTLAENFALHGLPYTEERIGGILKSYGFGYHDGKKRCSALSGGERSRLLFAILSQSPYHLLILDEPTNHLDYDTREALERALRRYEGAILFISHDRYFVNKLAQKLWIIADGDLIISYGNYEDYRYKREKGINLDMSLFDADGEMNLVLEEKLGAIEARRIREKFARKKKRGD